MWIVVAGLGLLPVYLWVLDGLVADLFFNVVVGAILVIGLLVAFRMPRHRAAWVWILAGQVCFLFGDLGFNYVAYFTESEANYSFADIFYLSGYPCTAIGLVLLLRVQGHLKDLGGLVDGSIVAVGTGVILWVFLMAPTAGDTTLTVVDRLIGCAYPAGDLLLITIGAQVAVRQLRRGIPFWILTASMMFMLAADVGYTVPDPPQPVHGRWTARCRLVDQLRVGGRGRGASGRVQGGRPVAGASAVAPDGAPSARPRRGHARISGRAHRPPRTRQVVGRPCAARRHDRDVHPRRPAAGVGHA